VRTTRGAIRVLTVIVAVNYARVPKIPYAVGVDIACRMKMTVLDIPLRPHGPLIGCLRPSKTFEKLSPCDG
jgi:hypothetical protein